MEIAPPLPLANAGSGVSERRFTVFITALIEDGSDLYNSFFGFPPDVATSQKPLFRSEYSAVKEAVKYAAVVTGPRIDFTISMDGAIMLTANHMQNLLVIPPPSDALPPGFQVLSYPAEACADVFAQASEEMVSKMDGITRLAVGETSFKNATSKEDAEASMLSLLPWANLGKDTTDFYYRVNRIKETTLGGKSIRINRIFDFMIASIVAAPPPSLSPVNLAYAVSVKTDVNTAISFAVSELKPEEISIAARMLFAKSHEMFEKGDAI